MLENDEVSKSIMNSHIVKNRKSGGDDDSPLLEFEGTEVTAEIDTDKHHESDKEHQETTT